MSEDGEVERVKELISEMTLPSEIESVEVQTRADSSGDPALWIVLWVPQEFEFDEEKAAVLNRAAEEVQTKLMSGSLSKFPYVTLDQAA